MLIITEGTTANKEKMDTSRRVSLDPLWYLSVQSATILFPARKISIRMSATSKYNIAITVFELFPYKSTFENNKYVKKQEITENERIR
jgi:hypothetical protein